MTEKNATTDAGGAAATSLPWAKPGGTKITSSQADRHPAIVKMLREAGVELRAYAKTR